MYRICPGCQFGFVGSRQQALCGPCNHRRLADRRTWTRYAEMRRKELERREAEQFRLATEAERQRLAAEAAEDLRLWLQQDVH